MTENSHVQEFSGVLDSDSSSYAIKSSNYRSAHNMLTLDNEGRGQTMQFIGGTDELTRTYIDVNGNTVTPFPNLFDSEVFAVVDVKSKVNLSIVMYLKTPTLLSLLMIGGTSNNVRELLDIEMPSEGTSHSNTAHITSANVLVFLWNGIQYAVNLEMLPNFDNNVPIRTVVYLPTKAQCDLTGTSAFAPITVRQKALGGSVTLSTSTIGAIFPFIPNDYDAAMTFIKNALDVIGNVVEFDGNRIVLESDDRYFEIESDNADYYVENMYDLPRGASEDNFRLIKKAAVLSPEVVPATSFLYNFPVTFTEATRENLRKQNITAYMRYHYNDGSITPFSVNSALVSVPNTDSDYGQLDSIDVLLIKHSRIENLPPNVVGIEFAIKKSNEDNFFSLGFKKLELVGTRGNSTIYLSGINNRYDIYYGADESLRTVPTDTPSIEGDLQVILPQSFVPIESDAIGVSVNDDGSSFVLMGGNKLNRDAISPSTKDFVEIESQGHYYGTTAGTYGSLNTSLSYKTHHQGAHYKYGKVYREGFGRRSEVVPIGSISVPNGALQDWQVIVTIGALAPEWATSWEIVRTKDYTKSRWQTFVNTLQITPDGDGTLGQHSLLSATLDFSSSEISDPFPLHSFLSSANNNVVLIKVPSLTENVGNADEKQSQTWFQQLFNPLKDKETAKGSVDLFSNSKTSPLLLFNGDVFIDFIFGSDDIGKNTPFVVSKGLNVVGLYDISRSFDSESGLHLVCRVNEEQFAEIHDYAALFGTDGSKNVKRIYGFEIYTNGVERQDDYYSIGISGKIENGFMLCEGINQTASIPMQLILNDGVSYMRNAAQIFPTKADSEEFAMCAPSPYSGLVYNQTGLGLLNAERGTFSKNYINNHICHTGINRGDRSAQRLNMVSPTDEITIDANIGKLVSIPSFRQNVLAVGTNKSVGIYVNVDVIQTSASDNILARTRQLLRIAPEFAFNAGAQGSQSIVVSNSAIYGIDINAGFVWRFAQDGMKPLNGLYSTEIQKIASNSKAYFSKHRGLVMFKIGENSIVYSESKNAFVATTSFIPTVSLPLQDILLDGTLYECFHKTMKEDDTWELSFVANKSPLSTKNISGLEIYGAVKPFVSIKAARTIDKKFGQFTTIRQNELEFRDGVVYGFIRRDLNSDLNSIEGIPDDLNPAQILNFIRANGDFVRSRYFDVILQGDYDNSVNLFGDKSGGFGSDFVTDNVEIVVVNYI